MSRFIAHWAVLTIALAVAAWLLPGIVIHSFWAMLGGGLVLGLVNAIVRPVLSLLSLPITILTLGLFYLVVNGVAFGLAAWLTPGFDVAGLGSAMLGALLVSVLSWIMGGRESRSA